MKHEVWTEHNFHTSTGFIDWCWYDGYFGEDDEFYGCYLLYLPSDPLDGSSWGIGCIFPSESGPRSDNPVAPPAHWEIL